MGIAVKNFWLTMLMISAMGTIAYGQTGAGEEEPLEFTTRYDRRHLDRDPKIGAALPDVEAFDEDGQPFLLAGTRGKYTVLVFGCLT